MRVILLILIGLLASNTAMGSKVVIENESDWDIHFLYLSPTSSDDWGPDQLGDEVLSSGSRFKIKGIDCDTYDVRIIDEDDDECVLTEIPLCIFKETWEIDNDLLLSCQEQTQGEDADTGGTMTLYNGSQWSIFEVYISRSDESHWGEDLLGDNTWSSGETLDIWNLQCADYDLRLVDEDDDVCELHEVFLCGDEGTETLTDEDLLECQGY